MRQVHPSGLVQQLDHVADEDRLGPALQTRRGERIGYGGVRHQVQLDNHTFAALRADGLLQRRRIGGTPGRQHDDEALLGKLLGDGAADAPAYADGQVTVVEHLPVRQLGIAAVGLPLGGRPHHDGDRFAG